MKIIIKISLYLLMAMNYSAIFLVGLAEWQSKGEMNVVVFIWLVLTSICFWVITIGLNKWIDILDEDKL